MKNSDYDLSPCELLRLQRIKRNEAKLKELNLLDNNNSGILFSQREKKQL